MILIMCLLFQTEGGSDGEKKLERRERERDRGKVRTQREVGVDENSNDLVSGFELAGACVVVECDLYQCAGHLARGVVKFLLGFH